jgi:flagellar hook-associated protein 1 FlgK
MSGIGLLLNTARSALFSQQYAIDVIGHNIANVDTPGYSRQSPVLQSNDPAAYGGFVLGRGVDIQEIQRISDSFVETRLNERKTDLTALNEKEIYMSAMEAVFNENSSGSLSAQFVNFFNAWLDLSNNPSGLPERNALFEAGAVLAQSFSDLSLDLDQFEREINLALETGVERVNQLTSELASIDTQIIHLEAHGTANDLRDHRNGLLTELSEYVNVKAFEGDDGRLTVITSGGYALLDKSESYVLEVDGDDITWEGSGGSTVAITDQILGGKIGGWLDMRDEILPKYGADLDELAKATIWAVNEVHAQGVGLEGFTDITGTYTAADKDEELWTVESGLTFYDKVVSTGTFQVWVYDTSGNAVSTTLDIDAGGVTSLQGLADTLDAVADLNAEVTSDNKLRIYADSGYSFGFSDDTSNALAALGVNTFFNGGNATGIEMNSVLDATKEFMAASRIDPSTGEYGTGDNTNALAIADLQYEGMTIKRWTYQRGSEASSQDVNNTLENYFHSLVGSVGIEGDSITRSKEYSQVIVDQLNETRDSISAVSLDEEMTNLIKFQHAYTAAARLITMADEMFKTLLDIKQGA